MDVNKKYPHESINFLTAFLVVGAISYFALPFVTGAQKNSYEVETKNGIKIVHNSKTPAGKGFKDLHWSEDLVIGGESENEDYVFVQPIEIVADALGNVYVLDYKDCTAKKFDSNGKFMARIGRNGQGPGEFEFPASISIDENNRVYFGDLMGKIGVFDPRGFLVKTLKIDRLRALKIISGERLIAESQEMVGDNDKTKRILRLAIEKTGQPCIVLYNQEQLPFGAIQNKDFRLEIPLFIRWDVSPEGRLYVGTANRYAIQTMTLDGRVLFEFTKGYDPLPIPREIRSAALMQLAGSKSLVMGVRAGDFEPYLINYPIFKSITADEKGRIWVELFQDQDKNQASDFSVFDVFSSGGVFIL
jgi:hypothetical protein